MVVMKDLEDPSLQIFLLSGVNEKWLLTVLFLMWQ